VHLPARIVYLRAFALFESQTCFSICLHTLRAVRVWPHAFERIKSGECACICLRVCRVWHLSVFIESASLNVGK
jgi:hypothetical protein